MDRYFEVVGLDAADLDYLRNNDLKSDRLQQIFTVYVVGDKKTTTETDRPPVLGSLRIDEDMKALRFEPRFPLLPGVAYRPLFRPAVLGGRNARREAITAEFVIPKVKRAPAIVERVHPSRDRLPENQLKFYLHFSAAMSRGQAYQHVRLLDDAGKPVELPFLQLDEELWDPDGRRFTLFFDPGRIKQGLRPREEVGPALVEGKDYTLVIDANWEDAEGSPLREPHRKRFRVTAPDQAPPDPKDWRIEKPSAGTVSPLRIRFPEPLDHGLLQRLLWITDDKSRQVSGNVRVADEETAWLFYPERPWRAGDYELVVDTSLEDLAGNSVGRPFELDLSRAVQRKVEGTAVKRTFRISAQSADLEPVFQHRH